MRHALLASLVCIGFVTVRAEQGQVFRSGVSGIAVHVSVRKDGALVSGLEVRDFVLTDNGVRQEITALVSSRVPLDVSLVVDQTETQEELEKGYRKEIEQVAKLLEPADRLRVVSSGGNVWDIVPLGPVTGPIDARPPVRSPATSTYDAIASVLVRTTPPGRQHVVIILTYGVDGMSITTGDVLMKIARRSDAQVHIVLDTFQYSTVALRRQPLRPGGDGGAMLLTLANATGGGRLWDAAIGRSITTPVKRVLETLRNGYLLFYTPSGVPEPGWHPIAVRVFRPGKFEIHARPGYQQ